MTLRDSTARLEQTIDLLDALEVSAREGAVVLEGDGVLIDDSGSRPVALQYGAGIESGRYFAKSNRDERFTRKQLVELAEAGRFVGTFTARHGAESGPDHAQPAVWTEGPIERQSGHQEFPILFPGSAGMTVSGRHIEPSAKVFVDGRRIDASIGLEKEEKVEIELASLPPAGMHLLQIQNRHGAFSNDFIFYVTASHRDTRQWRRERERVDQDIRDAIAGAIVADDQETLDAHLNRQPHRVNEQQPSAGSTPLSHAALHGKAEMTRHLIRRGADVNGTNRDGNTPLHVAAFLCHRDIVELLVEKGGSPDRENSRGETPIDVVASPWSKELEGLYRFIGEATGIELDLKRIERDRPKIARLLRER